MNWLQYLLEANLYLGIFYLCYCLFLNRETYYILNRVYLLSACIISFIIPIVQIGILKPVAHIVQTKILIAPVYLPQPNLQAKIAPVVTHFSVQDSLLYIYLVGVTVFVLVLAIKLYQLLKLIHAKPVINQDNYKLIYINGSNTAFSFFNYLFIGTSTPEKETIIRHELVHIRQKHSMDIIFLEVFKVINWFNPLIYLLQNSLKTVHEYIADEKTAVAEVDTVTYSAFLVNNAYGIGGSSVTHSFFNYNLLKRRIIMLNQKRSGSLARLKYLMALPLCAGLLCVSTLGFSKTYGWVDLAPRKTDTALVAPPPPPEPPALKHALKFKLPSPFGSVTKKGYRYAESGYMVNGKSYFRVIIQESKNVQKEYWKNTVNPAEVKMLHDKYGYTFPTLPIYPKLPPPPPAPMGPPVPAIDKRPPPPPPAPPHQKQVKFKKPAKSFYMSGHDSVYVYCDKEPEFPGGVGGFSKYLAKNVRYPEAARKNKIQGRVILQFIVQKDGNITGVKVLRGVSPEIDKEAARVLSSMPKWEPGINKGMPVICQYNVPVAFKAFIYN